MSLTPPGTAVLQGRPEATVRRVIPGGLLRRVTGWIRGWHGGQLLTVWAGAVIIPWQIGVWRETLIRNRLEGFLNPGLAALGWAGRVAEILAYIVLPLLAVVVTAIWVSGRVRRGPSPRG